MTFKPPTAYLDDHEQNHPDDVLDAARALLAEWVQMQESVGKNPRICAAAAVYRAYHDAGYDRSDPDRPTIGDVATEFETSDTSIESRLPLFPGGWTPNKRDDTALDAEPEGADA